MAEASELPAAKSNVRKKNRGCIIKTVVRSFYVLVVIILAGIALGPMTGSITKARAYGAMVNSSLIELFMYRYSIDHHGQYPTGKSSTEIFLKLLKGGYLRDPAIFYIEGTPGKIRSTSAFDPDTANWDNILKPENVCFDVTLPIDTDSSGYLPIVFLTGYRIKYVPGASAVPLSEEMRKRIPCMAVACQNHTMAFFTDRWFGSGYYKPDNRNGFYYNTPDADRERLRGKVLSDGTVTKFIPSTFDPAGKKYQQLTPDGPLPP